MKNLIKLISFLLATLVIVAALSGFVCTSDRKDTLHIRGFYYEPKNTIDVIAIGASELYTGFNSPMMWKEYGFTSYSIAFAGAPCSLYKSMLDQALTRQNPKLVIFEVNGFMHDENYMKDIMKMHTWFDNVPLSKAKYLSMKEIIPKDKMGEFIIPLGKYHENWRHPKICYDSLVGKVKMRKAGISYTKNFATTTAIKKQTKFKVSKPKFTNYSQEQMIDLLNYCKKKGLKNVLFLRTPHCLNDKTPQTLDRIEKVVKSYGYDFENYEHGFEQIGLDTERDFYNPDHVNVYGMEKMAKFLGQYIVDNYDVKSYHSKNDIDRWNECYERTMNVISLAKRSLDVHVTKTYYEISAY